MTDGPHGGSPVGWLWVHCLESLSAESPLKGHSGEPKVKGCYYRVLLAGKGLPSAGKGLYLFKRASCQVRMLQHRWCGEGAADSSSALDPAAPTKLLCIETRHLKQGKHFLYVGDAQKEMLLSR